MSRSPETPPVPSEELLEYVRSHYPARSPKATESYSELMVRAGREEVVQFLFSLYEDAEDRGHLQSYAGPQP